jgi:hypothetical protein
MARDYGQVFSRIWRDPDFIALPGAEQRTYLMLLSQESMNYAGVLDLTVGRWARYAPDTTPADLRRSLATLAERRYVLTDEDTEEVLVRSFIRNDGLWRNVRMLRGAIRSALQVQSPALRLSLAEELRRLDPVVIPDEAKKALAAAEARAAQQELTEAVDILAATPAPAPSAAPAAGGGPAPDAAPAAEVVAAPAAAPGPGGSPGGTRARAHLRVGAGAGVGAGAVALPAGQVDLEGVTEVDARERDDAATAEIPDTRPAPLDASSTQHRPAAEGAMPSARCPLHLELASPPPCGRCADARRAQDAWKADRDATVARARQEVAAELAQQQADERAAVAACGHCDERGMTEHGVRCPHTGDTSTLPPGRAAFLAEREKLRERQAQRQQSAPAPRDEPTAAQLTAIATALGARGISDRDERLAELARRVGHPVASSRELTRTEAGHVLDQLEREEEPLPPEPDDLDDAAAPEPIPADWASEPDLAYAGSATDPIY